MERTDGAGAPEGAFLRSGLESAGLIQQVTRKKQDRSRFATHWEVPKLQKAVIRSMTRLSAMGRFPTVRLLSIGNCRLFLSHAHGQALRGGADRPVDVA